MREVYQRPCKARGGKQRGASYRFQNALQKAVPDKVGRKSGCFSSRNMQSRSRFGTSSDTDSDSRRGGRGRVNDGGRQTDIVVARREAQRHINLANERRAPTRSTVTIEGVSSNTGGGLASSTMFAGAGSSDSKRNRPTSEAIA